MRSHSHLNTAYSITRGFDGSLPLSIYLKQFFQAQKKYGSKDRREISNLCFSYYRLGSAFHDLDPMERILLARFLCSNLPSSVLAELKPEWNEQMSCEVKQKFTIVGGDPEILSIFPFLAALSEEIEAGSFSLSLTTQPYLYLRARPGRKTIVLLQLESADLDFSLIGEDCIQLSNGAKIEELIHIDEEAVVQDLSSQRVLDDLSKHFKPDNQFSAWDCCAASGGKSILLRDRFPSTQITVSDVRESILHNLQNRFRRAGITVYKSLVLDLSKGRSINEHFDLIICDAPCSGSGTWSRTPEQMIFFTEQKLQHYSDLQKKIAVNACRQLKPDGVFIYITCSVFKKENEEVAAYIASETGLRLEEMRYYKGYQTKADTLFTALFIASKENELNKKSSRSNTGPA